MTDYEHIDLDGPDPRTITLHTREPGASGRACAIEIIPGPRGLDPVAGNADILLTFDNGERRSATFVTIEYLTRFITGKDSGAPHDAYMWASNLVIVKTLDPDIVAGTIQAMMIRGEIPLVFGTLPDLQH